MMNFNIRKTKDAGITLIALVVTIIVLLILAGVTINIAMSNNGIISKAKQSKELYGQAENNEIAVLNSISGIVENSIKSESVSFSLTYKEYGTPVSSFTLHAYPNETWGEWITRNQGTTAINNLIQAGTENYIRNMISYLFNRTPDNGSISVGDPTDGYVSIIIPSPYHCVTYSETISPTTQYELEVS